VDKRQSGFTLVELLIAVLIVVFITGAIYWSVATALQSWAYMKDELMLQKVLSQVMQELIEGTPDRNGLRDSLEIVKAYSDEVEAVYPWTDSSHMAQSGLNVYELDREIKPGASIPIAEARAPDTDAYNPVAASMLDWGRKEELNKVQLVSKVAPGSLLRFTFHPDPKKNPDTVTGYKWVKEDGQVFVEDSEGRSEISKNPFGIKITSFSLKYFDNANNNISGGGDVPDDKLQFIGGIEIYAEASLPPAAGDKTSGKKKDLISFVSLRNSPAKGGALAIKEGMRFPIPDSRHIRTFFLSNLSGIDDRDVIQLTAVPAGGSEWRLTVNFSRAGLTAPKIASYTVEYPAGKTVFSDKSNTSVEAGLNLLSLGPNGMYDYDYDENTDNIVMCEGEVELKVTKMDISGAALFIR